MNGCFGNSAYRSEVTFDLKLFTDFFQIKQ